MQSKVLNLELDSCYKKLGSTHVVSHQPWLKTESDYYAVRCLGVSGGPMYWLITDLDG